MMKKLKLLAVTFDSRIESWELPKFKHELSSVIDPYEEWFHELNADDDNPIMERYFYRYKLYQYKSLFNNPVLICLDQNIEQANQLFSEEKWYSNAFRAKHFPIKKLDSREYDMHQNYVRTYRIYNWMPLSGDDYRRYQGLRGLAAKLEFLHPKLIQHLAGFCDGIQWRLMEPIFANILELFEDRFVSFKGQKMLTFNFSFESNIPVPDLVGIGKGVQYGFGVVRPYSLNRMR